MFYNAHFRHTIFKILKSLKSKEILCLALNGGINHNSRVLYTVREFAGRCYKQMGSSRHSRQSIVHKLLTFLHDKDPECFISGHIKKIKDLIELLKNSGVKHETAQDMAHEIQEELRRSVPYRERLFKILFTRIAAIGTPLILIPITHTRDGKIQLKMPSCIRAYDPKTTTVQVLKVKDDGWIEKEENLTDTVRDFVRSSFD